MATKPKPAPAKPESVADWKPKLNVRLSNERRFEDFRLLREKIRSQGCPANWITQIAALQFPPLNGDPLEFDPKPAQEAYNTWQAERAAMTPEELANVKPTPKSTPPPNAAVNTANKKADDAVAKREQEANAWAVLRKKVDPERQASPMENARWCYRNYGTPLEDIDPEKVPEQAAIDHLKFVRSSDSRYSELLNSFIVKTIPNNKQMETEARYVDDGRRVLEMFEAFDREFFAGDAEEEDEPDPVELADEILEEAV